MNTTPQMPQGTPDSTTPMQVSAKGSSKGMLPALLLMLALGVIGGVLWWMNQTADDTLAIPQPTPRASVSPAPDADINADLQAADPGDTDKEFQAVDTDLNAL